jgi:hypothetical protein
MESRELQIPLKKLWYSVLTDAKMDKDNDRPGSA